MFSGPQVAARDKTAISRVAWVLERLRVRLTRDRRRRGVRPVLVEVSQEAIEFLEVTAIWPTVAMPRSLPQSRAS
jgi:hypothetical protein